MPIDSVTRSANQTNKKKQSDTPNRSKTVYRCFVLILLFNLVATNFSIAAEPLSLSLRYQEPVSENSSSFHQLYRPESWSPETTAVIVCDMWDSHHCVNAVRRGAEIAPRIDALTTKLRSLGVTIIHAPSGCMDFYASHPARQRSQAVELRSDFPIDIGSWCDQIPAEEQAAYPLDQSAGGEDDSEVDRQMWEQTLIAAGRNPRAPWIRQTAAIRIDEKQDFISDSGKEIWSILERHQIDNVMLVGVHTNMCVLGRPFGLRRLSTAGKNVVLVRDLTDTMYDPRAWPYVSHFTGTDLIISHVERYVCPTISSEQLLGGIPLRLSGDKRPHIVMLIAEAEYDTATTLPEFAAVHLGQKYRVTIVHADDIERNRIINADAIADADALFVSVRRRALPTADLEFVRRFVRSGKPVIGIRTASHAFSLRNEESPEGHDQWPEFDAQVFGGNYNNHFGNSLKVTARPLSPAPSPFTASDLASLSPGGSLYRNRPTAPGTIVLMEGTVEDAPPHPLAWTFVRADGGKSFYTSLGHVDDFAQDEFRALLIRGIHWATGVEADTGLENIRKQREQYAAGQGRQR